MIPNLLSAGAFTLEVPPLTLAPAKHPNEKGGERKGQKETGEGRERERVREGVREGVYEDPLSTKKHSFPPMEFNDFNRLLDQFGIALVSLGSHWAYLGHMKVA